MNVFSVEQPDEIGKSSEVIPSPCFMFPSRNLTIDATSAQDFYTWLQARKGGREMADLLCNEQEVSLQ